MGYLLFVTFLFLVSLIGLSLAIFGKGDTRGIACIVSAISGLLGVMFFLAVSYVIVEPGTVGIPIVMGHVTGAHYSEGLNFPINPLARVEMLSVRTHMYTMSHQSEEGAVKGDDSISAISKNGMSMIMEVSVPYRLVPSAAPWVFQNLGRNYEETIIRPAIATAVRDATAKFTEEEAYGTKRVELGTAMRERMDSLISTITEHYGKDSPKVIIVFPEVQLRNVELPPEVKIAINGKIATLQKIEQAKNEAKRKQVEAEGIQKFQDIVSKGITPDLLRWKGIEATEKLAESKNAKIVIIGNKDGLPLIFNGENTLDGK